MAKLDALEPKPVWDIFRGLAAVPRPSKKEQRVRAHVRSFADSHGLACREDRVGNLVIDVPASAGRGRAPITVLQAHLDMVCEKNAGTDFDFDSQGIRLMLDTDAESGRAIVRADGTTLGADNGMGVALALAAAVDPAIQRGPLEILLTVDEEAGMSGVKGLEAASLKGRRLLNLDSEEDDSLYIGCAGGNDTSLSWVLPLTPASGEYIQVSVSGLRGGHSGTEIHLNRGSAVRLLAHTLLAGAGLRILTISAGSKRNAIPREATATVVGPAGTMAQLAAAAAALQAECVRENSETDARIRVERAPLIGAAATAEDSLRLLNACAALPNGVQAVVPEIAGLIQTSNCASTITCAIKDGAAVVTIGCLSRSSSAIALQQIIRQIHAVGRLSNARIDQGNSYPGWQPNAASPTLKVCREVYESLFSSSPRIAAIHAGLECGILSERVPGMDMVSFGPTITGAHSPDERVYVDSVAKSWRYLTAVLAALS